MEFVIGGLAATSAGFLTNPLEVIKHHMELNKKSQTTNHGSFLQIGYRVVKHDGVKSLQKGLSPALGAHLVSYGMKLGTYEFCQNRGFTTNEDGTVCVPKSLLSSTVGGLLGQYLSNPFYLIKATHETESMQSDKKRGYVDTINRIYRDNGIRGFFRGSTASLPRAFIGTSQLTSFAVTKESLNKLDVFQRNPFLTTISAAVVAGIILTMAMTPFDMVLTKMYKQAISPKTIKNQYSGYLDCMRKIYAKNGLKPFYSGFGPLYMKLGPHTVLCLVFWEELKGAYRNNRDLNYDKQYESVPLNSFYKENGFLANQTYIDLDHYTENLSSDRKLSVYWY